MPTKSAMKAKKAMKVRRGTAMQFGPNLTTIRKVVAPGISATAASHVLVDRLVVSFLTRLAKKSDILAHYAGKKTLKGAHAGTAADLLLVGPMAGQAGERALEAWSRFNKSNADSAAEKEAAKEATATTEVEAA